MPDDTSHGASILIVDDTVENLRLLSGLLGDRGYEPRPVTNGPDALEAIRHALPELILLDVTMPGMDGFEVCRRIKANPDWREIPVIFLTALTDVEHRLTGLAVGGVDYVTKPFYTEEVTARVASHLALRRATLALRASNDQLRALEKMRDDLVQMIVHDIRGLMGAVIGNLELAQVALTGQAAADIGDALNAANAVTRMANTVLDVSRLEEGKMPLTREPTNVTTLAADAARTFGAVDATRAVRCIAAGPVYASCDADVVRRVIENLVSNAVKHTPSGGTVTVDVRLDGMRVRVDVRDEGHGVPEELRARLFEKYAASNKQSRHHSAGLGLAFCKLAVEAHGGTIGVAPAAPNGSVFSFAIPV